MPEVEDGYVTLVNTTYDESRALVETKEKTNFWAWKPPHKSKAEMYTKLDGYVQFFNVDFGYTEDKLVLKQGEIIERGTHQQLMDKQGQYQKLYTGVFELE